MAKLTFREKQYLRTSVIDKDLYDTIVKKLEESADLSPTDEFFREHWDEDYQAFLIEF